MYSDRPIIAVFINYLDIKSIYGIDIEERLSSYQDSLQQKYSIPSIILNVDSQSSQIVLTQIISNSVEMETLLIFHTNMPLLFQNITDSVIKQHITNMVDYTFTEYQPWGVAPFAIQKETLERITPQITAERYTPYIIDDFIKNDLNQYDVEIVLADQDYRFLKQDFFITDSRSARLFKKILDSDPPLDSFKTFLEHSIAYFRTVPTFANISLCCSRNLLTMFQAPLLEKTFLKWTLLEKTLLDLIKLNPDIKIQFTLQHGDPLEYDDFQNLLDFIKQHPHTEFYIETLGINLSLYQKQLISLNNIIYIFFISAYSENMFVKIHKSHNLNSLENNIETFLSKKPHTTYIQWLRMKENEEELPLFLEKWKAFEKNIIISQYDNKAEILPDYKVVDFAPLKRFPCFHLAREVFILPNGNIPLCSSDIQHPNTLTGFHISDIHWDSFFTVLGLEYQQQWNGQFAPICQKCDYWYIFNF